MLRGWVAVVVVFGWTTVARAACPTPVSEAQIDSDIEAAMEAYGRLDVDSFKAAIGRVDSGLPCVQEALDPPEVAAIHRVHGLLAFGNRDLAAATASFTAARLADPAYEFPLDMVPEGHPLRATYRQGDVTQVAMATVAAPAGVNFRLDGRVTDQRPQRLPSIWQQFDGAGVALATAYLESAAPVPWVAVPVAVVAPPVATTRARVPEPVTEPVVDDTTIPSPSESSVHPHRPSVPLLVTTVVTGVAAGVMYGVGSSTRTTYFDPSTDVSELDSLRSTTNAMAVGSTLAGGVAAAAGLGVVATVVW